jgi:hypothetical protein
VELLRNVSGMMRTSAVMIAAAGEKGFYRSVRDVPDGLRQQLLRVTAGENSGTIVIADKAGKEQLTQIVARRGGLAKTAKSLPGQVPSSGPAGRAGLSFLGLSWIVWAGICLIVGSAGVVAAVFTLRW